MPSTPDTVAAFLAYEAQRGVKASTLGRRAAAIAYAHRAAGMPDPTEGETVSRVIARHPSQHWCCSETEVTSHGSDRCPDDFACAKDHRWQTRPSSDCPGFAGAFRRSELSALTVADMRQVADGLQITIRHSKTDQESAGQEIAIPHGRHIRPVEAVREWLEAAGITEGPVFVL